MSIMRRIYAVPLVAALFLTASVLPARLLAAGDPARTALDEEFTAPARLLIKLWKKPGTFDAVKIVSLSQDTLYLAGAPRGMEAIDLERGQVRWVHLGRFPVDIAPIQRGNVLHFAEGGQVVTLNLASGLETGRYRTRVGFRSPIYPSESTWAVAATDDHIIGLVADSGQKAWRVTLDDYAFASTWDGTRLMYATTAAGSVYAVGIPTHEIVWHYKFGKVNCSPPVLQDRTLYVGSEDYYLYAFEAVSGAMLWKQVMSAPVLDAPLATATRLYVPTRDGLVHAFDPKERKDLWTLKASRVLTTTPERVIYLRTQGDDNFIGLANSATGAVLAEAGAKDYEHFAAGAEDGIFYAVTHRGGVLALGDRDAVETMRLKREAARLTTTTTLPAAAATPVPTTLKPASK